MKNTMKLTVALMDAQNGSLHQIKEIYPDLVDLFNELQDLRESQEKMVSLEEYEELERELNNMTDERDALALRTDI